LTIHFDRLLIAKQFNHFLLSEAQNIFITIFIVLAVIDYLLGSIHLIFTASLLLYYLIWLNSIQLILVF